MTKIYALIALLAGCNAASAVNPNTDGGSVGQQSSCLESTTCEIGPQGPQGLQGVAGPQGAAGPQGSPGIQGATGAAGPQGIQGPAGVSNVAGPQGIQGPQGNVGPAGAQGIKGSIGANGLDGHSTYVRGTAGGSTTATLGVLIPLSIGGTGIYFGSVPFPAMSGMVVTMTQQKIYFNGANCTGSANVMSSNFNYPGGLVFGNQFLWTYGSTKMYLVSSTEQNFLYQSFNGGNGCQNVAGPLSTGFQVTDSGVTFDVAATQPWTIMVQ